MRLNKDKRFSARRRIEILEEMAGSELDILVIGGGITGSGIALDSVSRGLKVGLVEKKDFASGTSSRSGKLIHGGLKYLKSGDLGLVKEVGLERAIVHENARHLVNPVQMLFPIVKNGSFNKVTLKLGLTTYDQLAGVKQDERHEMISKKVIFQQEPLFNREIVSGGGMYIEYRTDDSRLTLEVAKTAFEHGASICNYAEVIEFINNEHGKAIGVIVRDNLSQRTFKIYSKYIVNAGGPWVDKVRRMEGEIKGKRLHLTKGIHIVVPFHRLPVNQSVYFDVAGRMIAVVPRDGCSYIGSTETDYHGDLDDVRVERDDVDYLLDCVNGMFPTVHLKLVDITSSWAGLRPLIHEEGKPPAEMSRKDEIFESDSGLITIAGGKLTGYRKMAERVVDHVLMKGDFRNDPTKTAKIRLSGGRFETNNDLKKLIEEVQTAFDKLEIPKEWAVEFVYRYGTNSWILIDIIRDFLTLKEFVNKNSNELIAAAEAYYTAEHEMVVRLSDFFDRRTGYLLFKRNSVTEIIDVVASQFSNIFDWNKDQLELEKTIFDDEYRKSLNFVPININ